MDFEKIVAECEKYNVDYFDIKYVKGKSSTVSTINGQILGAEISPVEHCRVRMVVNGGMGIANFEKDYKETISKAYKYAKGTKANIKLAEYEFKKKTFRNTFKSENTIENVSELLKAESKSSEVGNLYISWGESHLNGQYYNTDGADYTFQKSESRIFANAVIGTDSALDMRVISGKDMLPQLDQVKNKAISTVKLLTTAKTVKNQKANLLLAPDMTGVLAHEAFGHPAESDSIIRGNSILAGKMGEKLAPDNVNLVDSPLGNYNGSYFYDNDGVLAQETYILKDGVLTNYLTSRQTAYTLGLPVSGNSRGELDQVRMSNTYIEPKDWKLDEMLNEVDYYYIHATGGQVDDVTGTFHFKALYGYKVENGELAYPIKNVGFKGSVLESLKNISAVGSDFEITPGTCGKGGEDVPVGTGGPHIVLRDVYVG